MTASGKRVKDRKDIFGGAARLLYADAGTVKPTQLSDIMDLTTTDLEAGWNEFGATDGGLTMTRGFEAQSREVDQINGIIDDSITAWNMSLEFSIAEVSLENIQFGWACGSISVNVTPAIDERTMGISAPNCIPEAMVAFIVDKRADCGASGFIRAYVYWRAKRDGSDSAHAYVKGEKTLVPVTLNALVDDTEATDATRFGIIIDQVSA